MAYAFAVTLALLAARIEAPAPLTYELQLVYVFEATPVEYLFVIGNSGFRSVASLQRFLETLPRGTTIRWAPGCERLGSEPLLSSPRDMAKFADFCRDHGIKLIVVPAG
jgi:hypothetical protein